MRIFLVSNMFPSQNDLLFGVFVKNFKIELEKQGVRFSRQVLIRGKSNSPINKAWRYIVHYFKILRHFLSFDYQLIYVHYLSHHLPVLTLILPLLRTPMVINFHGSDLHALMHNKWLNRWAKLVLRKAALLVVPTSYFKEQLLDRFDFLQDENIFVSPSGGIDKTLFYPAPGNRDQKPFTLGFIARLTEEKGWRPFLEALNRLKLEVPEFKVLIGGKGPDESLILDKIRDLGLQDHTSFLGFIPQDRLVEIYTQMHVYVFPTYRDSLGLTGLEAMSCGIPVISTRIAGGPTTYVTHGINGYLATPADSRDLFEKIMAYYTLSADDKENMARSAIDTAKDYEKTAVARKLTRRLQQLVSGPTSG